MVQTAPETVFKPSGQQHDSAVNSIVTVTPRLPFYVEVKTSSLNIFLQNIYNFSNGELIQRWLSVRQRTGFYFEINEHLHFAFSDQRDGSGSMYWWIIYYDNFTKRDVVKNIPIQQHQLSTRLENQRTEEELLWNGLKFRSQTEIKIAKALSAKNIIFFANTKGFIGLKGLALTNQSNQLIAKAEIDFIIFHNQKCMILEVDGVHHNETSQRNWDCSRDRVFLRQGIPTVRFSANQCYENTSAVIEEFLALFGIEPRYV